MRSLVGIEHLLFIALLAALLYLLILKIQNEKLKRTNNVVQDKD